MAVESALVLIMPESACLFEPEKAKTEYEYPNRVKRQSNIWQNKRPDEAAIGYRRGVEFYSV